MRWTKCPIFQGFRTRMQNQSAAKTVTGYSRPGLGIWILVRQPYPSMTAMGKILSGFLNHDAPHAQDFRVWDLSIFFL